jgi:diguanylate cyclase (GGDEF)-like protein
MADASTSGEVRAPRGRWASWRLISLASGAAILGLAAAARAKMDIAFPAAATVAAATIAVLLVAWLRARGKSARLETEVAELSNQLHVDQLTGLMNRLAFNAVLEETVRSDHETLIVLFFDLDRFKEVNDTLGHRVGDELLREVAERVRTAIRNPIALARLGGDEFAAIIPWSFETLPEEHGKAVVEALSRPFEIGGQQIEIGASIGIAVGDPTLCSGSELLRRADLAMYAAKASNKGRVRMFDDALDRHETRESSVRVELGKARIADLFSLSYQPIIDARTGRFNSGEALLRPQSPALRDVTPSALVSIAEASGQIVALTDWTLETALAAAVRLATSPIAVNISPIYFRQPDFVSRLTDKLLSAGVPPEVLTIEVTENVLIENLESTRQSLNRLRELGIMVYLDDFGTGYSSLSYLQNFELDGLKLDKSFLRALGDRRKTNQIIRSVIDFGHSLDMKVVVEGVESDWQARLLQLLGCDYLQGFEIGMPMSLDELIAFRDARNMARADRHGEVAESGADEQARSA